MDDIIKIVQSLEKSGLLNDGASKTVKHGVKQQEGRFLPAMMAFMTPSLINAIAGTEIRRAGEGQKGGVLPLLALPLIVKVLGKGVTRAGSG